MRCSQCQFQSRTPTCDVCLSGITTTHLTGLYPSYVGVQMRQALAPVPQTHAGGRTQQHSQASILAQVQAYLARHPGTAVDSPLFQREAELPHISTVISYWGSLATLRQALGLAAGRGRAQ